jgi:hypothetical protein
MTKEELKQYIQDLGLEADFEAVLFKEVDEAEQLDEALFMKLADLIDTQAQFYDDAADLAEEEADMYEAMDNELASIDEEEDADRAEAVAQTQEELFNDLDLELKKITTGEQDTSQQNQIQQELQQMANGGQPAVATPVQTAPPVQSPTPAPAPDLMQQPAVVAPVQQPMTQPLQAPAIDPNQQMQSPVPTGAGQPVNIAPAQPMPGQPIQPLPPQA